MNKLFLILAVMFFSSFSFSQQGEKEALTSGKEELVKSRGIGVFSFVLPKGNTKETVSDNAKYYTMYFTVSYNSEKNEVKINMVNNDEKSRHVICRFLVASGTEKVIVEGNSLNVEEFFQNYLK